jgi:4-alpha-glucanotransferase
MKPTKDELFHRSAGILLHPTSLPGPHGIGALGANARRFVDFLARAGVKLWQVLPLVPAGAGNSPYSSGSAFACNPWMIDLDTLVQQELLSQGEIGPGPAAGDRVGWQSMIEFKGPRLALAASRVPQAQIRAYRARAPWVDDAALFFALRHRFNGEPYWNWPTELRCRAPEALAAARKQLETEVDREIALQYLFEQQWNALRAYAHGRGVRFVGDMPIYVDADSADVWAAQEMFELDPDGRRMEVSGVPPDAFSETGQLWGNPLYRWDRMAEDDYRWWVARVRRVMEQTDFVRIDHFRAFAAYWAVPAGATDARMGKWRPGPGRALFDALRTALGNLPILAEDLGIIDDAVRHLLADAGLPGMKVLQFAFGERPENHYLPHNHTRDSVVYTGTHDNETTMGFWQGTSDHVRDHVRRYFGVNGHDVVWDLIRAALGSVSVFAIVPFQDLLSLGNEARMNVPAVASGNWGWRMRPEMLRDEVADRFRGLVSIYGR